MEIVGIYCHFMVYGGQPISFADTIGYEGSVVHSFRKITFIAGKQQDMVEIQITGFQHTHDL